MITWRRLLLMGEWIECRLGDIANLNMGQSPKSEFYNQDEIGLPFLQGNRTFGLKYPYFDTYCSEPKKIANSGDILFSVRAPVGDINIANTEICIGRGLSAISAKNGNNDFLYFLLHYLKNEIINNESGSVFGSINRTDLRNIKVQYPLLEEQKVIAEILSSLDDKIDLLHRQNKTLEELAQTLFRQWFIEEAKDEWEEVTVGDLVKTNVSTLKKDTTLQTIQYLDTSSLTEGKIDTFQQLDLVNAPSRAKRIVKHNDVLISTVRPNQRHYGIIKNPTEDIIVSTGYCVISCEKINPHFIYILLTTDDMTEYLHSIAEGSTSTYPSLKPSDIEAVEFLLPPEDKLKKFSDYADNAWDKIDNNHIQIKTLENMRDTLLPKLMSGEVRVKYGS